MTSRACRWGIRIDVEDSANADLVRRVVDRLVACQFDVDHVDGAIAHLVGETALIAGAANGEFGQPHRRLPGKM